MIFNSIPFLVFIVVFIPVFYTLKGKMRLWFTLLSSYFFYGWWDWRFLSLILISTFTDYVIGLKLTDETNPKRRKGYLLLSLFVNLGILGFFKYFNFFLGSFYELMTQIGLPASTQIFNIILPIGISFYTFQTLSYTIDIYFKRIDVERNLLKFSTFVAFFPQLVAGPIVRASDFIPQLNDTHRKAKMDDLLRGLDLVFVGYLKKVMIADSLAPLIDQTFASPSGFSSLQLIVGLFFYSFQIYCDFSGYSDIAIGLARMLGFRFPVNFNMPYISKSFSEFWTRWHISLSSWLRDYLYISLGGNRKGKVNTYKNLMLTMLLGGLWHGASWTFVFWGFLHGMYLVVQRFFEMFLDKFNLRPQKGITKALFGFVAVLTIYIAVCYAWIFFRAQSFEWLRNDVNGILAFNKMDTASLVNKFWIVKGILLIGLLSIFELTSLKVNFTNVFERSPILRPTYYALAIWSISLLGAFTENQFIYFQF